MLSKVYLNLKSLTVCRAECSSTGSSTLSLSRLVLGRNLSNNRVCNCIKHINAITITSSDTRVNTAAEIYTIIGYLICHIVFLIKGYLSKHGPKPEYQWSEIWRMKLSLSVFKSVKLVSPRTKTILQSWQKSTLYSRLCSCISDKKLYWKTAINFIRRP
jgi:hypothetical protein